MEFLNSLLSSEIFFLIIILIFSIVIHEMAHGYAALFLGDTTAERAGRLTLNPIPHIDIIGSIFLPGLLFFSGTPFLFGYAKPVPYNPLNLTDKKWGDAKVAAAGPISNLILAFIFMLAMGILSFLGQGSELTFSVLQSAVILNIFLAILNLLPVPPLDGSKILLDFLKNFYMKSYINIRVFFSKYQIFLLIGLFVLIFNFNFLSQITLSIYKIYEILIFSIF